jgi:hypothetical protein
MVVIEDSMKGLASVVWEVPVEHVQLRYLEGLPGVELSIIGGSQSWHWSLPKGVSVLPWDVALGCAQLAFYREVARILDTLTRRVAAITKALTVT